MTRTIEIKLAEQRCALGEAYARRHSTTPPKTAILSCEGMCLRGEIARRAANDIAHALAPERTVRVCHGGLLEAGGGMRDLIERADKTLMLDGCSIACGTRLLKGALPRVKPTVVFTDRLVDFDRSRFGVDEMPEDQVRPLARTAAEKIVATFIRPKNASDGRAAMSGEQRET